MDYATRYPETVPLKDVQAESVSEAVVNMFTMVGIPKEILSDQASQFLSAVMKEMCILFKTISHNAIPPNLQWPKRQILWYIEENVETRVLRNQMIGINMLDHCCLHTGKFNQDSLSCSPFKFLYGRTVRGPISVLREL